MYTYLTTASRYDGTLIAHVPSNSQADAERLAGVLHDVCICVVEVRCYLDGKLVHYWNC